MRVRVRLVMLLAMLGIAAACRQADPRITIASEKIPRHWKLEVHGAGFTPQRNVSSHLLRPDGSEFAVLPILTDSRGEFTHTIDTMILELGSHQLWVVDDASKRTSNRVTFEVTFDYPAS